MIKSTFRSSGKVTLKKGRWIKKAPLFWKIKNFLNIWPGLWRHWLAKSLGMSHMLGCLYLKHFKADGTVVDYGLVSTQLVTTAFVNFMVDQLQTETSVWGDFKYHDSGVGTTDPDAGDTGIETTDGEARATGSQTEGAANVYRSVGTINYTTTKAITEHMLFNDPTAGTGLDRSEFAAVNVVNGESIQFTFDFTCTAGG